MVTSDLVSHHSSQPYNNIGMQREEYSLKEVHIQTENQQHSERKMHSVQKSNAQWCDELMMGVHYAEFLSENECHIQESHHHPAAISVKNDFSFSRE